MAMHKPQPTTKGGTDSSEWITSLVFAIMLLAYIVGVAVILLDRPN